MPTKEEILNFSTEIENIVYKKRCDYMDAIVLYCEQTGLEVELAATLVSNPLKMKISEEVEKLNLIKKTNKLPL